MKYSVVIPCYNESHVIARCLSSVNAARKGRCDVQVIVVDNGSTDDSITIAESYKRNLLDQVISTPRLNISAVRNAGAHSSSGTYLLFLDGDMEVPENWLEKLDEWFDNERSDVLGFVDLPPEAAPWFARVWGERVLARRHSAQRVDFLPGRNIYLHRRWFDSVGGFDEKLKTGEDKDFIMRMDRAGACIMSDCSIDVVHLGYERSFHEWMRKEYWRQHSHIDLLRQQGLKLRLLRFPLLAVSHLGLLALAVTVSINAPYVAALLFIISFLPSLLMTLRCPAHRNKSIQILQATTMHWIRFLVAGVSILRASWEAWQQQKEVRT